MRYPVRVIGVAAIAGAVFIYGANAAVGSAGFPAPGSYRVDVESTRTVPAGPYVMTVVQTTDSGTGDVTVTRRSTLDPENVSTQTVPGEVPPLRCVTVAKPPAVPPQYACPALQVSTTPEGTVTRGTCNGLSVEDTWSRIDDQTWEHLLQVTQPSVGGGGANAVTDVVKERWVRISDTCAS